MRNLTTAALKRFRRGGIAVAVVALTAGILLTSAAVEDAPTAPEAMDVSPGARGQPRFSTLPPGSGMPSDGECAAKVRRSDWEPRPENHTANHTVPVGVSIPAWGGVDSRWNTQIMPRVSGDFTGTTDEIIQWAACKWGFDEDIVRAVAVGESTWRMSQLGDHRDDPGNCIPGDRIPPCPTSFGIMQVKWTAHPGTHPMSELSTAFNVDYALAVRRGCFEGYETWLGDYGDYRAGDEWGCVGRWYSGKWHDADADGYISRRKADLAERAWERPGF